jgi:hypothetical protein
MIFSVASSRLAYLLRAGFVLVLLVLTVLSARVEAQCTLASAPVRFEPNPPGAARPGTLSSGFSLSLVLYRNGAGSPRILMSETYGYSTLDISNPLSPTALKYDDFRFDAQTAATNPVPAQGDGQSYIQTIGVSPDGQRSTFSLNGPGDAWYTLVGRSDGGEGFGMWGDFFPNRASGTVVQQVGSRYIAYTIHAIVPGTAADVTTLPTANSDFKPLNLAYETTTFPPGTSLSMAGNYLVYLTSSGVQVIDASSPGPQGSITSAYRKTVVSSVPGDLSARVPVNYAAAVDPVDATKLWVLVELDPATGENSPSYGLVSITRDASGNLLAPVSAGPLFRVPSQAGETWGRSGSSASLVTSNGQLFALMWATRRLPTQQFILYSTTASLWSTPLASTVSAAGFGLAATSAGVLAGTGNSVYQYLPTGPTAFVVPLTCVPVNAPAASSLSVTNASAGTAMSSGGTAFIGDTLSIVPAVVPSPASRPLSSWSFDFDFHAGNAAEDAGTSPRIRNNDATVAFGPGQPLPATIADVGPCDPSVLGIPGGVSPGSGTGCWSSVRQNTLTGGPDFTGTEAAGATKTLNIAFEATNQYGIANTAVFAVNWVVPAAKIASTQVLSGQPLVSTSDGHPSAYAWSFGPDAQHLSASSCAATASSCVPQAPYNTNGTYAYSLTAKYFPDQAFTATTAGTYTVTNFAPAFTVNGSSTGPITAYVNQSLTVVNNSQRGVGVSANYQYSLCVAPCADNYVVWSMGDTPAATATIPVPATPGSYVFKIKANYTGGTAYWPDPAGAAGFPITVSNAPPPIVVTVGASPNPANPGDTVQLTCSATGGTGTYTAYQWSTTAGTFSNSQNPTFRASNTQSTAITLPATCTVFDSAGGQGLNTVNVTINRSTAQPISVTASASPNPAIVGNTVTFSCQATGGAGGYSYQWTTATGAVVSSAQSFYYNATSATSFSATCTATDSAGATGYNSVTLTVNASGGPPPGPACTAVDFTLKDAQTQQLIPFVGAGQFGAYQVGVGQLLQFVPTVTSFSAYSWTFGDGGTSSLVSPQYAYQAGGTRTASLSATGGSACTTPTTYAVFVTGPTGSFSAAYEDASAITYSNVTAFKNIVFTAFDAPSTVDAYSWDFGDGTPHGTGPTATHAFGPGSFTVRLTVTKGSASPSTTLALTVVPPPEPPKWVVPGMAYVLGQVQGATWQSDVTIFNPHPSLAATYSIAFLDARNPVTDYSQLTWQAFPVPPLGSIYDPNLLLDVFGQPLGAYGALIVRGDIAPLPPVIMARTFNNESAQGRGTFGLSVPQASVSGGVSAQASPAASVLIGLRQNAAAYTNLGLVNLHNDWPTVELDFFDGATAAPLGSMNVPMNPYQSLQINRALLDSHIVQAAGYSSTSDLYTVKVKILQGTAVYPYATVIDSQSTDPIVVTPTAAPSNTYRIPGVIRLTGANGELWRSRVTVANPSSASRKVHLVFSYVACNANGCSGLLSAAADLTFDPGQTKSTDDFVSFWLNANFIPVSDAVSYQNSFLDISPAVGDTNSDPLVVLGETYNATPGGHVGLQIPGFTPLDGASSTGAYKRLTVTGLASTTAYRTNLALFVVAGSVGKWVNVHVYSPQGTKLRDIPVFLDATGFAQVGNSALFGGLSGDLSRLSVVVDNIDPGVTVAGYATVIDNTSGDATFERATPAP